MTKTIHRTKPKRRSRTAAQPPRRSVTRREYAELAVRLGAVELQIQRNRSELELQSRRIAQLQDQVSALNSETVAQAIEKEMATLPLSTPNPTVES